MSMDEILSGRCIPMSLTLVRHQSRSAINICRPSLDHFDDWLTRAEAATIAELHSFIAGLRRDYAAVRAALSQVESNSQVEGQVNRLKSIKRSMYDRANFDLLRLGVLAA